jgi:hypothetical protein
VAVAGAPPRSTEAALSEVATTVGEVLRHYAERGLFQAVSDVVPTTTGAAYSIVWNGRALKVELDSNRRSVAFPDLLPSLPADAAMYRDLRSFVRALRSAARPAHRRVDPDKAAFSCRNHRGAVTVAIEVRDADFDYATRQLISAVHEIFTGFLADGLYSDYEYEHFGVSPWV